MKKLSPKQIEWLTWLSYGSYYYGSDGAKRTHDALIRRKLVRVKELKNVAVGTKVIFINEAGKQALKDNS